MEPHEEDVAPPLIGVERINLEDTRSEQSSERSRQRCADDVERESEREFAVAVEPGEVQGDTGEDTSFSDTENCSEQA